MVTTAVTRASLGLALASALALALGGLGHRWSWWGVATSFSVLRASAFAALGVAALALIGIGLAAVGRRWPALVIAVVALAIALTVVWIPRNLQAMGRSVPPIHDISTDTDNPPAFVAIAERRRGAPNPAAYDGPEVAAQQKKGYPDLGPLTLPAPPDRVLTAAEAVARRQGMEIVAVSPAEGRLEATATTPWFGFKDDVVVRVTPAATGSRVDVRSKSRVGRSDLGANAKRVRGFLAELTARLPT
jgi:uncharacterized protein (DUF1499 family)